MTRWPPLAVVGALVVCCAVKAFLVAGIGAAAASAALTGSRASATAVAVVVASASTALLWSFGRRRSQRRCEAGRSLR